MLLSEPFGLQAVRQMKIILSVYPPSKHIKNYYKFLKSKGNIQYLSFQFFYLAVAELLAAENEDNIFSEEPTNHAPLISNDNICLEPTPSRIEVLDI